MKPTETKEENMWFLRHGRSGLYWSRRDEFEVLEKERFRSLKLMPFETAADAEAFIGHEFPDAAASEAVEIVKALPRVEAAIRKEESGLGSYLRWTAEAKRYVDYRRESKEENHV